MYQVEPKFKIDFQKFNKLFFCIHGNHEERPQNIKTYKTKLFHNGIVYYEDDYPNILFAKDGEVYDFDGKKTLVIGGVYSVDKEYRLAMGYNWFESEQPNDEIKNKVRKILKEYNNQLDIVLSHTCPLHVRLNICHTKYLLGESTKLKLTIVQNIF